MSMLAMLPANTVCLAWLKFTTSWSTGIVVESNKFAIISLTMSFYQCNPRAISIAGSLVTAFRSINAYYLSC